MSARSRLLIGVMLSWAVAIGLPFRSHWARADSAPATTQPIGRLDPMLVVNRVRRRIEALNLTDDQRKQIDEILDRAEQQAMTLNDDIQDLPPVQKLLRITRFARQLRSRLAELLTPRQITAWRAEASTRPLAVSDDNPTESPSGPSTTPALEAARNGRVGWPIPPLRLLTPDGPDIQLSDLKGRVVVMEFGSMTCPSFRDHAAAMQRLQDRYGERAFLVVVYTREAHPAGQWEVQRNRDDGISIPQPADMTARRLQAQQARDSLHLEMPMVVDSMDDAAADALNGFPNAAVIIGRDGKIAARQQWTDPSNLPKLIEAALAAK